MLVQAFVEGFEGGEIGFQGGQYSWDVEFGIAISCWSVIEKEICGICTHVGLLDPGSQPFVD